MVLVSVVLVGVFGFRGRMDDGDTYFCNLGLV